MSSESEDETARPAKRPRNFAFKDLKQRIAEVDVNVYRRAAGARQAPLPGATCFTQEALAAWRELNTAADFTEVAAEIHNWVQSLPLLVHHGAEVANALLKRVRLSAALSAEPVLALLGTMPRDLRDGFLPMVPHVISSLTALVDEGAFKEPELMQQVFACMSSIFKHLQKLLAADVRQVLTLTLRLRYHEVSYVRTLTAQSVGLLFRHTPPKHLAAAVKAVLVEAALRPVARTEAAGQLLATAVRGVDKGLHSRAADVWALLLTPDLLQLNSMTSEQVKGQLSPEVLRDRTTAVAAVFIDACLRHAQREACAPLFDSAIVEVTTRQDAMTHPGASADVAAASSVARAASLVSLMASFHHGSRVTNWSQLATLTTKLLEAALQLQGSSEPALQGGATRADDLVTPRQVLGSSPAGHSDDAEQGDRNEDLKKRDMLLQALAALRAVLIGHSQSVGQSDGLPALRNHLKIWSTALEHLPCCMGPPLIGPLLSSTTAAAPLTRELGGTFMAILGRAVLSNNSDDVAASLPLLVDVCRLAAPRMSDGRQPLLLRAGGCGEALVAEVRQAVTGGLGDTAQHSEWQEAMLLCMLQLLPHAVCDPSEVIDICIAFIGSTSVYSPVVPSDTTPPSSNTVLPSQAASAETPTAPAAERDGDSPGPHRSATALLGATALRIAAAAAADSAPWRLGSLAAGALAAVRQNPSDYHALSAAATLFSGEGVDSNTSAQLPEYLISLLAPNLAMRSAGVRRETLRLLCCWQQPPVPSSASMLHGDAVARAASPAATSAVVVHERTDIQPEAQPKAQRDNTEGPTGQEGEVLTPAVVQDKRLEVSDKLSDRTVSRSDVLPLLLALEEEDPSLGLGRLSAVTLRRMGSYLEYGTVPPCLVIPLIFSTLGALNIRLASLWPPASTALAAALNHVPSDAWPLITDSIASAQSGFLSGTDRGVAASSIEEGKASEAQRQDAVWRLQRALATGHPGAHGGCTDASVRLSHLIKALEQAPRHLLQDKSRDWVPLMLTFTAAKSADGSSSRSHDVTQSRAKLTSAEKLPVAAKGSLDPNEVELPEEPLSDASDRECSEKQLMESRSVTAQQVADENSPKASLASHVGGRAWRSHIKEWLGVVSGLKGARGLYRWQTLRRAVALQLADIEPAVQRAALECLKAFKVPYVTAYADRLAKLADNDALRAQLASFPLAIDSPDAILPEHRPGLAGVLARLLFPKLRKRTGRLGGRGAPGSARAAILNFFASAPPAELAPLLIMFLSAFDTAFRRPRGEPQVSADTELSDDRLVEDPWWGPALAAHDLQWWLTAVDPHALAQHSLRQRLGLLHAIEDLLKHLGHRLKDYLAPLVALVQSLLERATAPIAAAAEGEGALGEEGDRELRSGTLKLMATIIRRFPGAVDFSPLWSRFFTAVAPLMPRLVAEVSSDKAPPLLEVAEALSADGDLFHLLGRGGEGEGGGGEGAPPATSPTGQTAVSGSASDETGLQPSLGERLLAAVVSALGAPHCSAASRDSSLSVIEHLLSHQSDEGMASTLPAVRIYHREVNQAPDGDTARDDVSVGSALERNRPELLIALRAVVLTAMGVAPSTARSMGAKAKRVKQKQSGNHQGSGRQVAMRALAVLEAMAAAGGGGDWEATQQLAAALLPLLPGATIAESSRRRGKGLDEDAATRVLSVLGALWRRLPPLPTLEHRSTLQSYVTTLAPLSGSLTSQGARSAVAAAIASLAAGPLPELAVTSRLLAGMVANSKSLIDEADYDARLAAYDKLSSATWAELPAWHAAPLVYAALADLRNPDDIALRHASAQALERLVDGVASRHRQHLSAHTATSSPVTAAAASQQEAADKVRQPGMIEKHPESDTAPDSRGGDVPDASRNHPTEDDSQLAVSHLLQKVLLQRCKAMLGESNLAVRQEHLALLRRLALALPESFPDLAILSDDSDDKDFFSNVAHLQLHRRTRALGRLVKLLRSEGDAKEEPTCRPGVGTLLGVIAPLLQQMVVEGRAAEGGGHDLKDLDRDKEANVVAAAVTALGAVSEVLPWPAYSQLLGRFLRLLSAHELKGVVRAVCAIIDGYHFGELDECLAADDSPAGIVERSCTQTQTDDANQDDQVMRDAAMDGADGSTSANVTPLGSAAAEKKLREAEDIRSALLKRVLPALNAHLVAKGDVVRPPVGLAVVKVLSVLPDSDRRTVLPGVLHTVAGVLKGRHQGIRDEARKVFVAMVAELGSPYLRFGVEVLQAALPAKGYTAQVLGYTVHALLEALSHDCPPGGFDDGLPEALAVVDADLFGEVADAKDVAAISGSLREAKKQRGYEAYRLLAAGITFRTHIAYLLSPVRRRLVAVADTKTRNKLGALLQHAARGVPQNPTATPSDILLFCHSVLSDGLEAEENAVASSAAAATAAVPHDLRDSQGEAAGGAVTAGKSAASNDWLLVEFALTLLAGGLKKGTLGGKGQQQLAQLDPMLPLLIRALRSRHPDTVSLSLRCLCSLVRMPLPGLSSLGNAAGKAASDLLADAPSTGEPLAQDCIKLLAGLLNARRYKATPAQLGRLLKLAFADVEEAAARQTAFSLLRAVMARGTVVPEVYDIIATVERLLVRAHSAPVRELATSTLLQYLLEYPVGATRLKRHVAFLLTNLEYEHEDGRLAVLATLSGIIQRFPQDALDATAEQLALPLVLRLVNDPSPKGRTTTAAVVAALFAAVQSERLEKLAAYSLQWLTASDARLRRAACQVVGILAKREGRHFGRRMAAVMPLLASLLTSAVETTDSATGGTGADDSAQTAAAAGWQEPYAGLLLLQTLHTEAPRDTSYSSPPAAQAWQAAVGLSLHPHAWVRSASARLLGLALADERTEPLLLSDTATSPGKLAFICLCQLEAPSVDEKLAKQAVKNALHIARPLAESAAAAATAVTEKDPTDKPAPEENGGTASTDGEVTDAASLMSDADVAKDALMENDAAMEAIDEEEIAGGTLSAAGLMRRVAKLAGDESVHRQVARAAAMGFIGAVAVKLRRSGEPTPGRPHLLRPFLVTLLQPLVRATETRSTSSDHFQELGAEVLASLRSNLSDPSDGYAAALNAARAAVAARRQDRTRSRALKRVLDPEGMAKERERKGRRKTLARQLRHSDALVKRSKGLPVKNRSDGRRQKAK